jgi:hypothetical protein
MSTLNCLPARLGSSTPHNTTQARLPSIHPYIFLHVAVCAPHKTLLALQAVAVLVDVVEEAEALGGARALRIAGVHLASDRGDELVVF